MPPVGYHLGQFPPVAFDWPRLIPLIGPANAALAHYDGLLTAVPNAAVLLAPMTTQEAVLSSRIEGTRATIGEVLEYEAAGADALDPAKHADIEEVLNYRRAMRQAVELLSELPLCNRLIKSVHATLLAGVRGSNKARGEFRAIANAIGMAGRPVDEARFLPIGPELLEAGMAAWERYLHEPAHDVLVQLAVIHAEFESLHPFLDGNGRIGRMLIPLYLYERKLLQSPMFYLSEYLEANRQEYYDRLLAVSRDGDWTGWCVFFLEAVRQQATENNRRARTILELYQRRKRWILDTMKSPYAIRALDFVFSNPVFNAVDFVQQLSIPKPTARRILANLCGEDGLFTVLAPPSGRRPAVYAFAELLTITEGREII